VIITGGSDGIGFEFANQLAKQGFNIILIARSAQKLAMCKEKLISKFPTIKVQTIVTDLSKDDSLEYYDNLFNQIKEENVSMLINCAGQFVGKLEDESLEKIRDCVVVNTFPRFMLTRNFLHRWAPINENGKKKAIVTIGCHNHDLESRGPSIWNAINHAVNMFMLSESQNYNVVGGYLMDIKPINVLTDGSGKKEKNWLSCTPEELVKDSLESLGQIEETFGCKRHIAYCWFSEEIRMLFGMTMARYWEVLTNKEMTKRGSVW